MTQVTIKILSTLTLFANIAIVLFILFFVLDRFGVGNKYFQKLLLYLKKKSAYFSLTISVIATLGSLFLSEIAGFTPCKLCWFQRIFMYPLPIILTTSIIKKKKDVAWYTLPLSLVGFLIASYHYYIQLNPQPLAPCSTVGFSVSCSERFVTNYGYITIPFMSLTAFFIVSSLMIIKLSKNK
jgi:disulfide bond formation protein DsbB